MGNSGTEGPAGATVEAAAIQTDGGEGGDGGCAWDGDLAPLTMVIFGASGDLTARKLIPAVYNLYRQGALPEQFAVVGAARSDWDDDEFRARMAQALEDLEDGSARERFLARLHYQRLDYDQVEDYRALGRRLEELAEHQGLESNRIYNLALPPALYETAAANLAAAGLAEEAHGYRRLVVEKPFGSDLASAQSLNEAIARGFGEHQVFRIDHYLAKETVQNVLVFRFANAIFEPIWNRRYVESVVITATETLGVGHRAGYYEKAGVLRDMFQNHMMQLLSLIALEPPSRYGADRVRDEKTKTFRSLRPFPVDELWDNLILGQYQAGRSAGREVVGYRQEKGVDPMSLTPTFAMMRLYVDNWRWQGVPFYLVSGKRLGAKVTRMAIQFKEVPHSLFRETLGEHISANRLTLGVHPEESISLAFQTKQPGAKFCLRSVKMLFDYHEGHQGQGTDAYDKALLDCMLGDHTLFWRQDGIELTWGFLDAMINRCETCDQRAGRLNHYPAGSWGPEPATRFLPGWPERHVS